MYSSSVLKSCSFPLMCKIFSSQGFVQKDAKQHKSEIIAYISESEHIDSKLNNQNKVILYGRGFLITMHVE